MFSIFKKIYYILFKSKIMANYSVLEDIKIENKKIKISAKSLKCIVLKNGLAQEGTLSLIGDCEEIIGYLDNYFICVDSCGLFFKSKSFFDIVSIDYNKNNSMLNIFNLKDLKEINLAQDFYVQKDLMETIFKNVDSIDIDKIDCSFEFLNKKRVFGIKWVQNSNYYYSQSQLTFFDKKNWNVDLHLKEFELSHFSIGEVCIIELEQNKLLTEIYHIGHDSVVLVDRNLAIQNIKNNIDFSLSDICFELPSNNLKIFKL